MLLERQSSLRGERSGPGYGGWGFLVPSELGLRAGHAITRKDQSWTNADKVEGRGDARKRRERGEHSRSVTWKHVSVPGRHKILIDRFVCTPICL